MSKPSTWYITSFEKLIQLKSKCSTKVPFFKLNMICANDCPVNHAAWRPIMVSRNMELMQVDQHGTGLEGGNLARLQELS